MPGPEIDCVQDILVTGVSLILTFLGKQGSLINRVPWNARYTKAHLQEVLPTAGRSSRPVDPLHRLDFVFGPLNGVRVALVTLAVLAALFAAALGYWMVTLVLVVGVALHGFGWLYLSSTSQDRTGRVPLSPGTSSLNQECPGQLEPGREQPSLFDLLAESTSARYSSTKAATSSGPIPRSIACFSPYASNCLHSHSSM